MTWPQYPHHPATPLRMSTGGYDGPTGYTLAWAAHEHTYNRGPLYFLSATDSYPLLRGLWAGIQDNNKGDRISLDYRPSGYHWSQTFYAHRAEGKGAYHTFWNDQPLAMAGGYAHLLMVHRSYHQPVTGEDFLHLSLDNQGPDLAHFFRQLDRALTLPIVERWTAQLWELGLKHHAIQPLTSHNCQAWLCLHSEDVWSEIITICQAGHGRVRVETYGAAAKQDTPEDETLIPDDEEDFAA